MMNKLAGIGWLLAVVLSFSMPAFASELSALEIDTLVQETMERANIPGLAVVILKDGSSTIKGYGRANEHNERVSANTAFELSSNSKAFTALAILLLESQSKVSLDDPITKYIPWLKLRYEGKEVIPFVSDFLSHTSGINENSIGLIPMAEGEGALARTIEAVMQMPLKYKPGTTFEYATVNYDVLGLLIEIVSGRKYAEFMESEVFEPLELTQTYVKEGQERKAELATGYKYRFLSPAPYEAPPYDGNAPAGYIVSTAKDLERWLKIQLQPEVSPFPNLIAKSQTAFRHVPPDLDGTSYAYGWSVEQRGQGILSHQGANPNYSSHIIFSPEEALGVSVIGNLNTPLTQYLAVELFNQLRGHEADNQQTTYFKKVDQIASVATAFLIFNALVLVGLLIHLVFLRESDAYLAKRSNAWVSIGVSVLGFLLTGYAVYKLPNLIFNGHPWPFIQVWAPSSVLPALFSFLAFVGLFFLYYTVYNLRPKKRHFFIILLFLSFFSGFGNAFIIFVINQALIDDQPIESGVLFFFVCAILLYLSTQKSLRYGLINAANNFLYEKRILLIEKILQITYQNFETIEKGKLESVLNNDTETLSGVINTAITSFTAFITLIWCFIYLAIINVYGFMLSFAIIFVVTLLYHIVSARAEAVWNEARNIQNLFFRLISDVVHGFKELKINQKKSRDFKAGFVKVCKEYTSLRIKGEIGFSNIFIIGEILFVIVIGFVTFAFPSIFRDIGNVEIRNYVLVFLYMTGPVNEILNAVPFVSMAKISWQRINEIIGLDVSKLEQPSANSDYHQEVKLELDQIRYSYESENRFSIGPISASFSSGEIIFITGGNGSGKTTLAKIISGLYSPDSGDLKLGGQAIPPDILRDHFSIVFADYHLFDRLYGVDLHDKVEEIDTLIQQFRLDNKITIKNGVFSTTNLSTGQRKRLALIASYLEDRPIYLFDEWAADQDVEFRKYFYETLLSDLKSLGKCVIVVSHDQQYFSVADRIINLEMGQLAT